MSGVGCDMRVRLRRLDEHRIRVQLENVPPGSHAEANGWITGSGLPRSFAFNCMAYTDFTVGVVIVAPGKRYHFEGSVEGLAVGDTVGAIPIEGADGDV